MGLWEPPLSALHHSVFAPLSGKVLPCFVGWGWGELCDSSTQAQALDFAGAESLAL